MEKRLRTLKKLSSETGASVSFLKQLIRHGKLNRYRVNSAVYVSLTEFETLAETKTNEGTTLTSNIN